MKRLITLLLLGTVSLLIYGQDMIHEVTGGDTLYSLAREYNITVDQIRTWNKLENNTIYTGQRVIVGKQETSLIKQPVPVTGYDTYTVKTGDTLWGIARKYDMSVSELRELNGGRLSRLKKGQEIKVALPESKAANVHIVKKGETLEDIAYNNGLNPNDIMTYNQLPDSRIFPGDRLYLTPIAIASINTKPRLTRQAHPIIKAKEEEKQTEASTTLEVNTYVVQKGDTLYSISRNTGVSVGELRLLNTLENDLIQPNQILKLEGTQAPTKVIAPETTVTFEGTQALPKEEPTADNEIIYNGDSYYNYIPTALSQPDKEYREAPEEGPWLTFQKAVDLYSHWIKDVKKKPSLGNALAGYHFVIDPGHGGLDPGAIVESIDGRGDTLYVVEDEYVYDIALRLTESLVRNGADVTLTILSPNHTIRNTDPAGYTLVHQTNEVYNLASLNVADRPLDWPRGGHAGLEKRVLIAEQTFDNVEAGKRVFISLHADNAPESPKGTGILYLDNENQFDKNSADFAEKLIPYLGYGAYSTGRDLAVLRNNPADIALLIELRNIYYKDHSWAIRFSELRQSDVDKISKALVNLLPKS